MRMAVNNLLIRSGIRTIDHTSGSFRNRKDIKMTHGFRKFFETQLVNTRLQETIIRKLTGHSDNSNLTQLYSKQTMEEMLAEYERTVDRLTINPENRLRRKFTVLQERNDRLDAVLDRIDKLEKEIGIKLV